MRGRQPRPDRSQPTAYWLKKLGAEPADFLPPRSGGTDGVEVVARVEKDNFEKVLRGSGESGVFSRLFFVKDDAHVYKDVPLPVEFDFQAAVRKVKAVGLSIFGVVLRGKGLGLRTKECDFESVVGQVYSEEESKRFIGERWEATSLPLSWSEAAVQAFLAGWPCTVEASFRAGKTRSTIIRSAVPPVHRRLQHDFGCSQNLARGTTQTSTSAGHGVVKAGKNYSGKPKGCKILGECGPRKPHAAGDSETSTSLEASRWTRQLSVPPLPPRFKTTTRDPRRSRSRQGRNGWTPCNLCNLQCWQTWSRSYRYSWRRCSRLRQLSDSSGACCIPSKQKSR